MPTDTSDGCKRVLFDNMQQNLYEKNNRYEYPVPVIPEMQDGS